MATKKTKAPEDPKQLTIDDIEKLSETEDDKEELFDDEVKKSIGALLILLVKKLFTFLGTLLLKKK